MFKKLAIAFATTVMAGTAFLPTTVSAQSLTFSNRDRVISDYCDRHPRDRDCWDWKDNRHSWKRSHYDRWYRSHQPALGSFAAGIFGFALGAAIAGSDRGSSWQTHVARCEARYRSYNPRTDMYLGYDGDYHRCRL